MFLNPKFKIFVAPTQQLLSHHKVKQFLKVYANIFSFTPRLSEEDSVEYEKVKTAILVRYELTSEAYREKFGNAFQLRDESFREYTVRQCFTR
jgi:hypothetical protein